MRSLFLAALLLTTALSLPAAAQTVRPPAQVTATPSADRQVVLQADSIEYDSVNQTVSAVGKVEIADQGRVLLADRVTYDQQNDRVTASGNVSVTDEGGNVAFASAVVLTDRFRNGALTGFGALIGKRGRLAAASASRISWRVLPTPEKITLAMSPPAARTRANSPPETMSKPQPARANTCNTPSEELAFMA